MEERRRERERWRWGRVRECFMCVQFNPAIFHYGSKVYRFIINSCNLSLRKYPSFHRFVTIFLYIYITWMSSIQSNENIIDWFVHNVILFLNPSINMIIVNHCNIELDEDFVCMTTNSNLTELTHLHLVQVKFIRNINFYKVQKRDRLCF